MGRKEKKRGIKDHITNIYSSRQKFGHSWIQKCPRDMGEFVRTGTQGWSHLSSLWVPRYTPLSGSVVSLLGSRERGLFHDSSVDERLDIVLSVTGVDDSLSLGALLDLLLCEYPVEAHV